MKTRLLIIIGITIVAGAGVIITAFISIQKSLEMSLFVFYGFLLFVCF